MTYGRACEALSGKSGAGPPCAVREALNKMPDFVCGESFDELRTGLSDHTVNQLVQRFPG